MSKRDFKKEKLQQVQSLLWAYRVYHQVFETFQFEDMSSEEIEVLEPDLESSGFDLLSEREKETIRNLSDTGLYKLFEIKEYED